MNDEQVIALLYSIEHSHPELCPAISMLPGEGYMLRLRQLEGNKLVTVFCVWDEDDWQYYLTEVLNPSPYSHTRKRRSA